MLHALTIACGAVFFWELAKYVSHKIHLPYVFNCEKCHFRASSSHRTVVQDIKEAHLGWHFMLEEDPDPLPKPRGEQ